MRMSDLSDRKQVLKLNASDLSFEVIELKGDTVPYEVIRDAVEGYIERAAYSRKLQKLGINIWVNEEYRVLADPLRPSIVIPDLEDYIGGNVFFDRDMGDEYSYGLTTAEIDFIKSELKTVVEVDFNGVINKARVMFSRL